MSNKRTDVYLCSKSPRRQELLTQIGVSFEVLDAHIDESLLANESPEQYVSRLAQEKAVAGWEHSTRVLNIPVLGADTIVVSSGEILGKPRNKAHALKMLKAQSGKTQHVLTAISLIKDNNILNTLSLSKVTFRKISTNECEAYWLSGEPADKAGGWAIQGKGAIFIEQIEGSYSGVMGLPLYEIAKSLKSFGIDCI